MEVKLGGEIKEFEILMKYGESVWIFSSRSIWTEKSKFLKFSDSAPSSNLNLLSAIGYLNVICAMVEIKSKQMYIPPVECTFPEMKVKYFYLEEEGKRWQFILDCNFNLFILQSVTLPLHVWLPHWWIQSLYRNHVYLFNLTGFVQALRARNWYPNLPHNPLQFRRCLIKWLSGSFNNVIKRGISKLNLRN